MSKIFLKAFLISFCLLLGGHVFGQGTSNKGKDFWVAYQGVSDDLSSRLTLFITSNSDAVVNISAGGQALPPVNISAGQAVPVSIDPNIYTNTYLSGSDVIKLNAGIHVTSNVDIIVYAHISIAARSASSLILPVKALGNEYYGISYVQSTSTREAVSEFSMIGVEDGTVVNINPKANSIGNTRIANTSFQIILNKGDVYQYKSATDLTGSKITTVGGCKPLAVFSGSTFIAFCEPGNSRSASSGDPLYQQLFPVSAWGQNFVTAPFFNAQNGSSDIFRIQVAKDNTTITVNGSTTSALGVNLNNPYAAGSVVTFGAKVAASIVSDKPISVTQFQVTQACNVNGNQFVGDPEMTILNPIEQTLKDITVYSALRNLTNPPTSITSHYINIILKTVDIPTLKVDGALPLGTFRAIDATYSFITVDVTLSSNVNPSHRIKCDGGFVAIAYGYGQVESYAYLAGADLKNLNAAVEIFPKGETVQASSLCVGEDYNVKLKLPYITTQITWNFNNGAKTESISNPTYTPETDATSGKTSYYYDYKILSADLQTAGSYNLKATVLNPNPSGCDANEDVLSEFDVFNLPTAKFSVDNLQICEAGKVTFTDASLGNGKTIEKWFWDFGDRSTLVEKTTAAAFTYAYANPGDYNVKLYVKGETGCVSNINQDITIHVAKLPQANFTTALTTCLNQDIQFTDSSVSTEGTITKWEWNFGDPTSSSNLSTLQNPTHIFTQVKTYDVTLKVTTDLGCENVFIKQVKINPLPVAGFNATDICLSDASASFINTSTIADASGLTYEWNFGDDKSTPANNISTLTNPTHIYTEAKVYQVTLTVTSGNGCVTPITKPFTVNANPVASFTIPPQACINNLINFIADDIPGQNIIEYLWTFADGTIASTKTVTHAFTTVGVKKNKLSVKSAAGCWSPVKDVDIDVVALPVADFIQQNITCVGGSIQFTDKSTSATNNIIKWDWDFGDPTSSSNLSTLPNPTHIFTEVKIYSVTLKVTTDLGCEKTVVKQVKINPLPIADFETPDICLSDASATFTNTSTVADGSTLSYVWNFGDSNSTPTNNTSTAKNPSHIYTQARVYQVSLTVTSFNGCVTSVIKPFTVNGSTPKASFTVQNDTKLCSDQQVTFEDHGSVDFGEVTKIEWIYDNSNPTIKETDDNPATRAERAISPKLYKHTYPTFFTPATKTVNVKMTAYSGITCYNSAINPITLKAIPKVEFTLPNGCLINGEANFTNQSTFDGAITGLTYLWDFGDGSATSTDKDPVHKFTSANTYQITLTVTAPNGCVNTVKQAFTVNGAIPKPNFTVSNSNNLCSDQVVTFTDATTTPFGEIKKIEWYFDFANHPNDPAYQIIDNSPAQRSATAKTYQFTYPKFNSPLSVNKKVRMVVTSNGDCTDEITNDITLKAVPNVVFNPLKDVCAEVPVYKFTQASENTGFAGIGTYTGDGVDATGLFTPAKAGVGKHTITYTFVGANGCSAAQSQDITVFETPSADAGIDKIILIGGEILLDATATGKNLTYKWTPSTGLNKDDILNPVATPTKDVIYTLMVTSDDGCMLADEVFVKVLQFPEIPNTFTPNGDGVNDTWNIKYLESYPNSTVKIFNRYGKEVFFSTKYKPWDGKLNGEYLPEGMYYYIITAKNNELKYTGSVLIVK